MRRGGDEAVNYGRVTRDRVVWPLYWTRTAREPAGSGILLVLAKDLDAVGVLDAKERNDVMATMATIAPVWTSDYRLLAPHALEYVRAGVAVGDWLRTAGG